MPCHEPDFSDPGMLVGVYYPEDPASLEELAYVLAEEYAALGLGESRMLELFRDPNYAIAHNAFTRLGEARIRLIVRECADLYGRVRFVVRDAPDVSLVQIDPGD